MSEEFLVVLDSDEMSNSRVLTFPSLASGTTSNFTSHSGAELKQPEAAATDAQGNLYVGCNINPPMVLVYEPPQQASGAYAPSKQKIAGVNTELTYPLLDIDVDVHGNIYVLSGDAGARVPTVRVTIYAPGATGNVKPFAKIQQTFAGTPQCMKVDGYGNVIIGANEAPIDQYGTGYQISVLRPDMSGKSPKAPTTVLLQGDDPSEIGAMAFDPFGQLYVAQSWSKNIPIPRPPLFGVSVYANGLTQQATGTDVAIASYEDLTATEPFGAIAADARGNVYASYEDNPANGIQVLNLTGGTLAYAYALQSSKALVGVQALALMNIKTRRVPPRGLARSPASML